jgi:hypothetical protein
MSIFKRKNKQIDQHLIGGGMSMADFYKKAKLLLGQPVEVAIAERNPRGVASHLSAIPLDMFLSMESIENYVEDKHKAGEFILSIRNMGHEILCFTTMAVGRIAKSRNEETVSDKQIGASSQLMHPQAFELINKLIEKQNGGSRIEEIKAYVELQKMASSNPMVERMIERTYENMLAGGPDPIQQMRETMAVVREFNPPQIQPQDSMTALVTALAPALAMFFSKGQSLQAMAGFNQANPSALPQTGQTPMLPASPPGQLQEQTGGQMAGFPPNGQSVIHRPSAMDYPATPSVQSVDGLHDIYYKAWILPLMRMVNIQAKPEQIAYHIISMVTYAINQTPDSPHPLVKGLVESIRTQQLETLEAGLSALFGNIDALNRDARLQSEIKQALMAQLAVFYENLQGTDEDLELEDEDIEETEIQEEVNDADAAKQNIANSGITETG